MQLPLIEPSSNWVATPVSKLPLWPKHGRVAVDCETRDPKLTTLGPGWRRGATIAGVAFAIEGGPAHYLPVGHEGGGNLDRKVVFEYLRDQAKDFRGDLVGAQLSYDLDGLAQADVHYSPRRYLDALVAEPLLDENQYEYNLDAILRRRALPGKDETHLRKAAAAFGIDPKADLHRLHARHVGAYGERDVRAPLDLLRVQEPLIAAQDLGRVWDVECRVLPVLVAMRRRGVRVDHDHLLVVEAKCFEEEKATMAEFSRLAGRTILPQDMNRAAVIGPAVEELTGQKLPRTPNGGYQLKMNLARTNILGLDGPVHPAVSVYLRARRYRKTRTTFVESVRQHAVGNRIHCTFNQMKIEREDGDTRGTVSGRLSAVDPNLQQQPNRDPEIGPLWRATYIPDDGGEWACLDFSQQEPRWVVHVAEKAKCLGALAAGNEYRRDPTIDLYKMMQVMVGWEGKEGRSKVKGIYLGLVYGMGGGKLCKSIGLPTVPASRRDGTPYEAAGPEGQLILDQFNERAPFLRAVAWAASDRAKTVGYVLTALGRRCRFEPDGKGGHRFTHKALNRVVQGSSADQVKMAMVLAEDAGIRLQLQVHDELDLTIKDRSEAHCLAEIMREALPCRVPHLVEPKIGANWGAAR